MKLPPSKRRQVAAVAIEINPVDTTGSATTMRGIVVRSATEPNEFSRILTNENELN